MRCAIFEGQPGQVQDNECTVKQSAGRALTGSDCFSLEMLILIMNVFQFSRSNTGPRYQVNFSCYEINQVLARLFHDFLHRDFSLAPYPQKKDLHVQKRV